MAHDARTGEVLWRQNLGLGISAPPITYEVDGKQTFLSPEISMEIQQRLGSDIAMVFDEYLQEPAETPRYSRVI